jgi:hypothetical protein
MASDEQQKGRLSRLIGEGEKKGQEIAKESGDLVQFGQQVTDLAGASRGVLKYVTPTGIDWEPQMRAWRYVNEQEEAILGSMKSISMPTATSSASTAAYSMLDFANPHAISSFVVPDRRAEAITAVQRLSNVIERQAEKGRVLSLLRQYGLATAAPGQRSPMELFETAWAAFEKPVARDSASTSLLPVRDCMNGAVAALLRRCSRQERTSKNHEKILSIGEQLAGNAFPQSAIQDLAGRYEELTDKLSASKQRSYSREEWGDLLRRATLFLRELLDSMDQSKMTVIDQEHRVTRKPIVPCCKHSDVSCTSPERSVSLIHSSDDDSLTSQEASHLS